MKIGYACICLGELDCKQYTCTKNYATQEKLMKVISRNLSSLQQILCYNQRHHIKMFRISSDLIPFGSSDVNTLPWQTIFSDTFQRIGQYIREHDMRVSMHPGQYTLLNALDDGIVQRSIQDLEYHCAVLDLMQLDQAHKLILHIGGVYQDKQAAIKRFIKVYRQLPASIKRRLVIENDDRYYTIEDVLAISKQTAIPVVFDNLHHQLNPATSLHTQQEWIQEAANTWTRKDGVCKLHYSEQDPNRRFGAHAMRIDTRTFLQFVKELCVDVDIMLEVKDKNFSAVKACALLGYDPCFYEEWDTYGYCFYLHAAADYLHYARAFAQHEEINRSSFYACLDKMFLEPIEQDDYRRLLQLLYETYEKCFDSRTLKHVQRYLTAFEQGSVSGAQCIGVFYRIACRHPLPKLCKGLVLLQNEV